MLEIDSAERRVRPEDRVEYCVVDAAYRRCDHSAENALAVPEIAFRSSGEVIRERLDRGALSLAVDKLDLCLFLWRHTVDQTQCPRPDLAGDLGCRCDRRLERDVGIVDV